MLVVAVMPKVSGIVGHGLMVQILARKSCTMQLVHCKYWLVTLNALVAVSWCSVGTVFLYHVMK
jgi:hypothetical protein